MTAFFETILNIVQSLFSFLGNILQGLGSLISNIYPALNLLTYSLSMLPPEIAVIGTAMISVSIAYLIIGR